MHDTIPTWAIVATVKEPEQTIKEFLAHYLSLGCDEIHLFFDDPNDPAAALASGLDRVFPTLCTDAHWNGHRPTRHQRRQTLNAQRAYAACECDWIIHLDADEYLHCRNGISKLLAKQPETENAARVIPAEPFLHPRDKQIRAYNTPLPNNAVGRRIGEAAFGKIYPLLGNGLLSHTAGKFFLRTGLGGNPIAIHRPNIPDKATIPNLSVDDILLLHHHGCDEDYWVEKFQYRIKNTYSAKFWDNKPKSGRVDGMGLNAYLSDLNGREGEDGLRGFFRDVYHIDQRKAALRRANAIHRPKLWLSQKSIDLFGGPDQMCRDFAVNPDTGRLQATATLFGFSMIIEPDFYYFDETLAAGRIFEKAELTRLGDILNGMSVTFWDNGAKGGAFSLLAASVSKPDSVITAFEIVPYKLTSLRGNIAANGFANIRTEPVILGDAEGQAVRYIADHLDHSKPESFEGATEITARVETLAAYVTQEPRKDLSILRLEASDCAEQGLVGLFEGVTTEHIPDYILYNHTQAEAWAKSITDILPANTYDIDTKFAQNTLLKRT